MAVKTKDVVVDYDNITSGETFSVNAKGKNAIRFENISGNEVTASNKYISGDFLYMEFSDSTKIKISNYQGIRYVKGDYGDYYDIIEACSVENQNKIETYNSKTLKATGTIYNDTIAGNEFVYTPSAKNPKKGITFDGGKGDDEITGTDYNDVIIGGDGYDTITGSAGNDTITGGNGSNKIVFAKGDGNDTINLTKGEKLYMYLFDETEGTPIRTKYENIKLEYSANKKDLIVYIDKDDKEQGSITLKNFATKDVLNNATKKTSDTSEIKLVLKNDISGTEKYVDLKQETIKSDDIKGNFTGTWLNDNIDASATTLYKKVGKTTVEKEEKDRGLTLNGGDGNDYIDGGVGNDKLFGGKGHDELYGGAGADTIYGDDGNDLIFGGEDNDTIYGGKGKDSIEGGNGNDEIYGGADNDTIEGGEGNDSILGGSGNDKIYGGAGKDTIYGEDGNDFIQGDEGDDYIDGGNGKDTIYGGSGNNFIDGGSGDDVIYGGNDNNTINGGAGNDFIEVGAGNNVINGDDGNDFIYCGFGNDSVDGGDGNDTLQGWGGDDTINGGAGNDYISCSSGKNLIDGGSGNDSIIGGNEDDTIYGGAGNDTIYGDYGNDSIKGGEGDNELYGAEGNDTIYGGDGNDLISGGDGNDEIYCCDGNDTIHCGEGNDFVVAGGGNNIIYGDAGDDDIRDGYGNDKIYGGSGNDFIYSDNGNDSLYGGDGNDNYIVSRVKGVYIEDESGANDVLTVENYFKDKLNIVFNVSKNFNKSTDTISTVNIFDDTNFDLWADNSKKIDGIKIKDNSIEKIKSYDGYYVTSADIANLAQDVAAWLTNKNYADVNTALAKGSDADVEALIAIFNNCNWQLGS